MDAESRICGKCVGDDYLRTKIRDEGEKAPCASCERERSTISVEELGELVHQVFKKYARRAEPRPFEPAGKTPKELIEEILECEPDLTQALLDYLWDSHHLPADNPESDWYDEYCEDFELEARPSSSHAEAWNEFVHEAKYRGRFFNDQAWQYLDDLLTPLLRGDLHDGFPPIVTIGAEDSPIRTIYRGRAAPTVADLKTIYANPARELAPPPAESRMANRLNAAGVSVFYGSLDIETCVAEVRPSVGGGVVVGKFKFLSPVRLLDFRMVDNSAARLSRFDPEFSDKVGYGRLVRRLHNIIRAPVLPNSEAIDYVPTQMIAEYLASNGIDGMLYVSSLLNREDPDDEDGYVRVREADRKGVNVALFGGAAVVVHDRAAPKYWIVAIEEPLRDFTSTQFVDARPIEQTADTNPLEYPDFDDALEPTLRLANKKPLTFSRVRGISYEIETFDVDFTSLEKMDEGDLPF
jgi:hypothetical protein